MARLPNLFSFYYFGAFVVLIFPWSKFWYYWKYSVTILILKVGKPRENQHLSSKSLVPVVFPPGEGDERKICLSILNNRFVLDCPVQGSDMMWNTNDFTVLDSQHRRPKLIILFMDFFFCFVIACICELPPTHPAKNTSSSSHHHLPKAPDHSGLLYRLHFVEPSVVWQSLVTTLTFLGNPLGVIREISPFPWSDSSNKPGW